MWLLIFLLLPSILYAGQIEPAPIDKVEVVPPGEKAPGLYAFSAVPVAKGKTVAVLHVDRKEFADETALIEMRLEMEAADGSKWWCGITTRGGVDATGGISPTIHCPVVYKGKTATKSNGVIQVNKGKWESAATVLMQ